MKHPLVSNFLNENLEGEQRDLPMKWDPQFMTTLYYVNCGM